MEALSEAAIAVTGATGRLGSRGELAAVTGAVERLTGVAPLTLDDLLRLA